MMEAFRDRTIKIDVPYNIRLDDEIKIYQKDFGPERIKNIHIAPHTLEVAAMWAVLTRLDEPKKAGLTLLQKLKLYNGKSIPGFTEDSVKELKEEAPREGMNGISPATSRTRSANALVSRQAIEEKSINPFMVLNELESGLSHHSLISDENTKKRYRELLAVVKEEYEDIIKGEVQRAISADEDAIRRLCANYIENVRAYTQKERVKNRYTGPRRRAGRTPHALDRGEDRHPRQPQGRLPPGDHELHRRPRARRQEVRVQHQRAPLPRPRTQALRGPARHDQAQEPGLQRRRRRDAAAKIDVVKQRLIKNFGYNEASATDVLNYVASIFATRGYEPRHDRVACSRPVAPHASDRVEHEEPGQAHDERP
jgi:serine protein kinase